MLKKWLAAGLLLLAGTLSLAKTVATVAGQNIDSSEIDRQVKIIVAKAQGEIKDSQDLRKDILQSLITRKIAVAEAKRLRLDKSQEYLAAVKTAAAAAQKQGVDKKPGFKADFAAYQDGLLADIYAVNFLKKNEISDAAAKKTYDAVIRFYQGSEEVKIGEILTRDESAARKAVTALNSGGNFSQVAKKYTIDQVLKNNSGIYNEYVNLKDLQAGAPQYYAGIRDLQKNQYTPNPLKSPDGWLVIKVIDRRPAKLPAFNNIKNSIKMGMAQDKMQDEAARLNQVYKVKIY